MRNSYKKLASFAAPLIARTGIHRMFANQDSGLGSILMFHRVIPKQDSLRVHNHHSLEISPEHLEEIIHFFKDRDYHFASIQDLPNLVSAETKQKKVVVFTFDDGYLDNYKYAYPIFKKHGIPFTIYITTNFIERKTIFWWYLFEQMLLEHDRLTFQHDGRMYDLNCASPSQKEVAFEVLRNMVIHQLSPLQLEQQLKSMLGAYYPSCDNLQVEPLTWDQIRILHADHLVTIGAHTCNHYSLTMLSEAELYHEIIDSKERLETELGAEIQHFAYPFGKRHEANGREYRFVKKHQFVTAVTTNMGCIYPKKEELLKLNRININAHTTTDLLTLQVSGFLPKLIRLRDEFRTYA